MTNYQKTQELFKKEGVPYDRFKTGDQMSEEKWLEQVKNPVTGDFWQLETLKAAGFVPSDFKIRPGFEGKKFPVKEVNAIIRVKTSDGKEWLVSRQMHYGLDKLGNILNQSFDDKEVYDMPYFDRREVPIAPNSTKTEKRITGVSFFKTYDKPFNAENLDELFSLVKGDSEESKEGAVSLSILRKDPTGETIGAVYGIQKYRDFKNRDFDELYDYASTPKTRESTRMGREEEDIENRKKHKQYS